MTRSGLRHELLRRRNARISELGPRRGAGDPLLITVAGDVIDALLMDGDPAEFPALDADGSRFYGIPLSVDYRMAPGTVAVRWPSPDPTPISSSDAEVRRG